MSINELDTKFLELRERRNMEAEIKAEITAVEDALKAEMLDRKTETLNGSGCEGTVFLSIFTLTGQPQEKYLQFRDELFRELEELHDHTLGGFLGAR